MVIAIMGESCTGKSTIAAALQAHTGATVFSGKDYLRLARDAQQARQAFAARLLQAADAPETVVYVVSEPEQLSLLPARCVRVRIAAELSVIQERFAGRMGGKLPPPVAEMLARKHGTFDAEPCDLHLVSGEASPEAACADILSVCRQKEPGYGAAR